MLYKKGNLMHMGEMGSEAHVLLFAIDTFAVNFSNLIRPQGQKCLCTPISLNWEETGIMKMVNIKECHSKVIIKTDILLLEDNFCFVKIT